MREFLESPNFVTKQDSARPYNKELLIEIFDSGKNLEFFENLGKYEEVLYIAGIGSGKSYVSSMAITYIIYRLLCLRNPQKYFHFAKGTKIAFVNISKSFTQAKDVVFGEIKNRIDNNQWFQNFYPPDPRIKSKIRLPKNIFILPLGSNEESPLGYNIFGAVIDEASFHTSTKDKDYAEESYNQIKKRIRSRFFSKGKTFIITSPRYVYDFAEKKWEEEADNPKVFKRRTPLWEAIPEEMFCGQKFDLGKYVSKYKGKGVMIPIEYEDEFIKNPEKAMRDYGAQPSMSIQGFFNDPDIITSYANYKRKHPISPKTGDFYEWFYNLKSSESFDTDKRFIHIDLGLNKEGKGDCAGFAMGKFNGWIEQRSSLGKMEKKPKIFIDFMLQIKARPKDEIQFEEVRKLVYKLRDIGYNIHKITFDGWQSTLGSTKIKLLDGTNKRIDEIDKKTWIYSYDLKRKEIVPALCHPAIKTGVNKKVYEIILDNGEKLYFTPEHLFLMRDGSYKEVQELKPCNSIMPLYTDYLIRKNKTDTKPRRYEKILQPETNNWEMTHDMVARNIYGKKSKNNVVHHRNFNSEDNRPLNLEYQHYKNHLKMHKMLTQKANEIRWSKKGMREKQAQLMRERNKKFNLPSLLKSPTKEIAKKIALIIQDKWDNDKEYKIKMLKRPVYYGKNSPHYNRQVENELLLKICSSSNTLKEVRQRLELKNNLFIIRRLKSLGYKGFRDYKSQKNHKVVSVKFYKYEDVYDIEVPKYHNFALSAGIFVHNSVDSVQTLKSAGFNADFLSVDRKAEAYYTLKGALLDKRLDFYFYKPFIIELQQLEEIKGMKIDHPRGGSKDVCLAGNTKISLLNGKEVPIKKLVGKSKFEVYSVLPNGQIKIGKIENVVCTGLRKDIYRIWLDNNKHIDCTSNHPFLLRNGRYKRADKLKINDKLMPLYRKLSITNSKTALNGYEMIRQNNSGKWVFTHQLVAKDIFEFTYKNMKKTRKVIHHKDFDKRNNASGNLEIMSWDNHRELHNKVGKTNFKMLWKKPEFREICKKNSSRIGKITGPRNITKYNKSKERIEKLKRMNLFSRNGTKVMNKLWQDLEFRKRHKERLIGSNNPFARKDITLAKIIFVAKNGFSQKEILEKLHCTQKVLHRILRENEISKHEFGQKYYKSKYYNQKYFNHKIIKIEKIKPTKVFDMKVKKYHNFALSAGVFVHNSDAVAGVCFHAAQGTPGRGFKIIG